MSFFNRLFPKNENLTYPLHDDGGSMAEYETITDGFGMEISSRKVRDVPWGINPIAGATPAWLKMKQRMQQFLFNNGIGANIDEVAVMFHSEVDKAKWIRDAVAEESVKLFNSADDVVHTSPILSRYTVEYDFLEVKGLGMRVEAMYIDSGTSPLHDSLLDTYGNPTISGRSDDWNRPVVVHFSFKTTKNDYETIRAAMVSGGAELVQACHSTYGQFSYYRVPLDGDGASNLNVYLKPRVNSRDPETVPPSTSSPGEFGHPGVGSKYSAEAQGLRPIKDNPQA